MKASRTDPSRGVWFAGSQNAAHFYQPYDTVWLRQFFFSHLLERRVEWLDAGFATRYCYSLVCHGHKPHEKRADEPFFTSWVEQALRTGAAVPCIREGFTSLGRLVEYMADGSWGLGITRGEAKKLADRYDEVESIKYVGWNEGREKKIIFSEVLQDRVTKLFEDPTSWAQQPGDSLWKYVSEVGRSALYDGLRRTEATDNVALGDKHRGLRVTDFGWALHDQLFPGQRLKTAPTLSQVVEKAKVLPEASKVWALCKLVADVYADNFAALTTQRQFALSVNIDTRRLILGGGPSAADRPPSLGILTPLTSFQFPTVEEFLSVDPWRLEELRGTADDPNAVALAYFNAVDRWRANDDENIAKDIAKELGARLRVYCEHICAAIDQRRGARPTYLAVWGPAGSMFGAVLGEMASHAITQLDPDASGAIGYFLVGAGALAGLGAGAVAEKLSCRAAEAREAVDRTWDMDGSLQPTCERADGALA